ncbi:phosphopantetheine-binding protein [Chloroflexota bacterium]
MNVSIDDIISIVSLQLGAKKVSEEQRLVEDLGAESADIANIIAALEERYNIFINEEAIAKIRTVKDLYLAIAKLLGDQEEI